MALCDAVTALRCCLEVVEALGPQFLGLLADQQQTCDPRGGAMAKLGSHHEVAQRRLAVAVQPQPPAELEMKKREARRLLQGRATGGNRGSRLQVLVGDRMGTALRIADVGGEAVAGTDLRHRRSDRGRPLAPFLEDARPEAQRHGKTGGNEDAPPAQPALLIDENHRERL